MLGGQARLLGVALRQFRWLAAGAIPAAFDLRRLGWRLRDDVPVAGQAASYPLLALPAGLPLSQWLALTGGQSGSRRLTAMLGIDDPVQRSRLLRLDFGEALDWGLAIEELEARVERMVERAWSVPRMRKVGALLLDLVAREGFVAGRAIGLNPREFALVWRLAEEPGRAVSPATLLADVWRLSFTPETNSLAVHVSRLRKALRLAGLDGLIETTARGAYRLAVRDGVSGAARPGDLALDAHLCLRKERACEGTWEKAELQCGRK